MKWLLIALLAIAVYHVGFGGEQGEFDAAGNPKVVLFVIDGCAPCDNAVNLLKRMRVDFELLRPMTNPAANERFKAYRTKQYPLLVIGDVKAVGFAKHKFIETYAKAFGMSALGVAQQRLYQAHFNSNQPKVVMYGASWCGYCKKARQQFAQNNIEYVEWDVEKNPIAAARFKLLAATGYPLIYVGFERMTEFNKSKVNKALQQWAEPI